MQFYPHKRRNPPGVIIIALIDVLIVVLIFMLVTTTFKQQPALKLALPESAQARVSGTAEMSPLILSIDQEGNFYLGTSAEEVSLAQLKQRLAELASSNPDIQVALNSDRAAPFGSVIQAMDAVRAAGVKTAINAFTRGEGN